MFSDAKHMIGPQISCIARIAVAQLELYPRHGNAGNAKRDGYKKSRKTQKNSRYSTI